MTDHTSSPGSGRPASDCPQCGSTLDQLQDAGPRINTPTINDARFAKTVKSGDTARIRKVPASLAQEAQRHQGQLEAATRGPAVLLFFPISPETFHHRRSELEQQNA